MEDNNFLNRLSLEGIKIDLKTTSAGTVYSHNIYNEYGALVLKANAPMTGNVIQSCLQMGIRYLYYSKSFDESKNPAGLKLEKNAVSEGTQERAKEAAGRILNEISHSFDLYQQGRITKEKVDHSRQVIADVIDEITINDDAALITLRELKHKDEYTFVHSASVGVMASALAVRLGFPRDRAMEMGVGGLMHDIGKSIIGLEIVHKIEALTSQEVDRIKEHPHIGYKIVEFNNTITGLEKQIVLLHHEKPDGSGYPFGFMLDHIAEKIPKEVRLVSLCDTFSALTTKRSYKPPYSPKRALRIMQNSVFAPFKKTSQFLYEDFRDFIRGIGFMINYGDFIFHEGEYVRLNTGEIAMVMELRKVNSIRPVVRLVTDRNLQQQKRNVVIDMANDYHLYIANILDKSSFDGYALTAK